MENMNELLYMVHMKDESALKELIEALNISYQAEISHFVKLYPPLYAYKSELLQEVLSTLSSAIESYRYDMNCSFRSYATILAKRKICRQVFVLNHQYISGFNGTSSLDDTLDDKTERISLYASKDVLGNPEYVLHMKEAGQRVKEAYSTLPEVQKNVYNAWSSGCKYADGSERVGITYKQYESNLAKVKGIVHRAVMS